MKTWCILLVALVARSYAGSLTRSEVHEEFEQKCADGETVSGFSTLKSAKDGSVDVRFQLMCKPADKSGTLQVGECRDADEFEVFNGEGELTAENKFGSKSNCHPGEYLAGIKSKYSKDDSDPAASSRTMQFICCSFANAKVEEEIGCHHVKLPNILAPLFATAKSKIATADSCQQHVLSAVEIAEKTFVLKFCPVTVESAEYNQACKSVIKEKVVSIYQETFKETEGSDGEEFEVEESTGEGEGGAGEPCLCICSETCEPGGGDSTDSTGEPGASTEGGTEGTGGTTEAGTEGTGETTPAGTGETTPGETGATDETGGSTEAGDTGATTPAAETTAGGDTTPGKSSEESTEASERRRHKRGTRVVKKKTVVKKTITKKTVTKTTSVSKYSIEEEQRDGMTVFILVPKEQNELKRCPEDQCNCPATCPGAADPCEDEGAETTPGGDSTAETTPGEESTGETTPAGSTEEGATGETGETGETTPAGTGETGETGETTPAGTGETTPGETGGTTPAEGTTAAAEDTTAAEDDEECKEFGAGHCKKEGKCEEKCKSWKPGGGGDVESSCDTGKCVCCYKKS